MGITVLALVGIAVFADSRRDRLWAATGFGYAALIALVPTIMRDGPGLGWLSVVWMFGVVWTTDIAAYFTGRAFGGPKLAARISPKKTWSGFVGGLAGATLVGTLVVHLGRRFGAEPPIGLLWVALASAVASVASQIGDGIGILEPQWAEHRHVTRRRPVLERSQHRRAGWGIMPVHRRGP